MSRFYSGKAFEIVKDFSAAQDAIAWIAVLLIIFIVGYMMRRML